MNATLQLLSSFLFMIPTVTAAVFPNAVEAAVAPESGVRLYTEANYSGTRLQFSPGETYDVSLDADYRNQISALYVPEGVEVTLIDNDGGGSQEYTFEAGNHNLAGRRIDNQADAIVVTETSEPTFISVRQIFSALPSTLDLRSPSSVYDYVPCPEGPFYWPAGSASNIVASLNCRSVAIA